MSIIEEIVSRTNDLKDHIDERGDITDGEYIMLLHINAALQQVDKFVLVRPKV